MRFIMKNEKMNWIVPGVNEVSVDSTGCADWIVVLCVKIDPNQAQNGHKMVEKRSKGRRNKVKINETSHCRPC